jgi:hypothetical protein
MSPIPYLLKQITSVNDIRTDPTAVGPTKVHLAEERTVANVQDDVDGVFHVSLKLADSVPPATARLLLALFS